jgi:hypothetical protein
VASLRRGQARGTTAPVFGLGGSVWRPARAGGFDREIVDLIKPAVFWDAFDQVTRPTGARCRCIARSVCYRLICPSVTDMPHTSPARLGCIIDDGVKRSSISGEALSLGKISGARAATRTCPPTEKRPTGIPNCSFFICYHCYCFRYRFPGQNRTFLDGRAGTDARQVLVSGQLSRNRAPGGIGSGSGE